MAIRLQRYVSLIEYTSAIGVLGGSGAGFVFGACDGYKTTLYSNIVDRSLTIGASSALGAFVGGIAGGFAGILWPVAIPIGVAHYAWTAKRKFLS